jgi:formylglycine-generating enzyme required for sulfatase activity
MNTCSKVALAGLMFLLVGYSVQAQDRTSDTVASSDTSRSTLPESVTETLPGGIALELVLIGPGEFMMGAVPGDDEVAAHEKPPHRVTISSPFCIGKYEVTQAQWKAVMGTTLKQQRAIMDPSAPERGVLIGEGPDYPMYYVRWSDAREFCRKLGLLTGNEYRLPTEAEWEYACRAGSTTQYSWGDEFNGDYAWYEGNSGGVLHLVGQKLGNEWGLFDMAGNAFEWCAGYYYPYSSGNATDPENTQEGEYHVIRGGSWGNGPSDMRASHRFKANDGHFIGFRVARDVQ